MNIIFIDDEGRRSFAEGEWGRAHLDGSETRHVQYIIWWADGSKSRGIANNMRSAKDVVAKMVKGGAE